MNYNHSDLILEELESISGVLTSLEQRINKLRESSLSDGIEANTKLEEFSINLDENFNIIEQLVELIKTNEA